MLGQPLVIDNRGGANAIIGSDIVAKAAPDGYTLMHISVAFAINPSIYKKLPFDTSRDFTPITNPIVGQGSLLAVNPSLPAKSVTELIALAKKQKLTFSSPGVGNVLHLIATGFSVRAGIEMLHVPYKGAGPALTALLGGEVQVMVVPPVIAVPHIKSGRLRPLGYSGAKRLPVDRGRSDDRRSGPARLPHGHGLARVVRAGEDACPHRHADLRCDTEVATGARACANFFWREATSPRRTRRPNSRRISRTISNAGESSCGRRRSSRYRARSHRAHCGSTPAALSAVFQTATWSLM